MLWLCTATAQTGFYSRDYLDGKFGSDHVTSALKILPASLEPSNSGSSGKKGLDGGEPASLSPINEEDEEDQLLESLEAILGNDGLGYLDDLFQLVEPPRAEID